MSDLVPVDIEWIVGAQRHPELHIGRAFSDEHKFYILHSRSCLASGIDLRDCPFSVSLDRGIDVSMWEDWQDMPVVLDVVEGDLIPVGGESR